MAQEKTMSVKMTRGSTKHLGVPFIAGTSQDTIHDFPADEGERLIGLGVAVQVPVPPKKTKLFAESSGKIRQKIADLEAKLEKHEAEKKAALDGDIEDPEASVKKIETSLAHMEATRLVISQLQAKLETALVNEKLDEEKRITGEYREHVTAAGKEAKEKLQEIAEALSVLAGAAGKLESAGESIRHKFLYTGVSGSERMGLPPCPLADELSLGDRFKPDVFHEMLDAVTRKTETVEAMARRTGDLFQERFITKHFKTEEELREEISRMDMQPEEPPVLQCEARSEDWKPGGDADDRPMGEIVDLQKDPSPEAVSAPSPFTGSAGKDA